MARKTISLNDSEWRVGAVPQKPFGGGQAFRGNDELGEGEVARGDTGSDEDDRNLVKEWLPATVPGDVRLDLLRAGKITDPFIGSNNEDSLWVDEQDWWYEREVRLDFEEGDRAFLIFDGVDYQCAIYADGQRLGSHTGMFSRQVYELDPSDRSTLISVRIWGSDALPKLELSTTQKLWALLIPPLYTPPNKPFPDRYATLKSQMQFGWDFAPRLRTSGIWDDARIVITRSVWLVDARIRSQLINDSSSQAHIQVSIALDSDHEQSVRAICTINGKGFPGAAQIFEFDLHLQSGNQTREVEFDLRDARDWFPWDRGEQNLYELKIAIAPSPSSPDQGEGQAKFLDVLTINFGIRSFQLERRGAQGEAWTFVLNGKREFLRGANWVPLDAIPGRLTRTDYAARLKQARDANINFLRVWGGGMREKSAFYELCDEMGILVWQEFPFAGAILDRFPSNRAFLQLVRSECGAIVRALRNHPSLVVWCGGNEFNSRGNRAVVDTLQQVVAQEDGTRPFKPVSPHRDESHNWRVWHRMANLRDYKKDPTPFLSEFGLQSVPNIESLEKFMPLNAAPKMWEYHNAELKKLERYAVPAASPSKLQSLITNSDSFIIPSQRAQAFGLQIGIEHMRRAKARDAAGAAIWQLNDAWGAISWSVIDYYGVPKQAYFAVKRAYSPVLVSFDYALEPRRAGTIISGNLWLVNDLRSSFANAQLSATIQGKEIHSQRVNVEPDSAIRLATLAVPLSEGENKLQLKLTWGPAPLCVNEYDLNYCDIGEINPLVALYVAMGNRLMR